MRKKKIIILFSILLILYSFYNLSIWFINKKKTSELQENLKEISNLDQASNTFENNSDEFLHIDFKELLKKNKDTVAWIKVNGTAIDYPVVQSNDNKYYLNHSFDNSISQSGWIFSDFRNNLKHLNPNSVIYGHGRVDNTMFGSLRNVINNDWFEDAENHIIKLSTPSENMIWEIFSVYTILNESYYITTHFNNSSFQQFIDRIIKRSIFSFSTTVTIEDKILTLSTCKNDFNQRIVIHAKLIKKETLSE